jgi:uncharacterized protein YbjT (DUF2867 family)
VRAVLVTGATGFTGSHVVPLLLERGYRVRCLVRPGSDRRWLPATGIEWFVGDLADTDALARAMAGVDLLLNVASLGFGHGPGVVAAARAAEIRRAVWVSTTAVLTTLNARSREVRLAAEQLIAESGIPSTVVRPTMIYGGPRDRNIHRLVRLVRRSPVIPVIGSGRHLQQPVHVADIAGAIVACAATPVTEGRTYAVAGPEPLTYDQVIDSVAAALGRKVVKVHFPASPVVAVLSLLESAGLRLPIKSEQVLRLEEDKSFDIGPAQRDFGYSPRPFLEGLRLAVSEPERGA